MLRKQFFPSERLADMLKQDSKSKGVSESTLIADILSDYYGLNSVKSTTSMTALVQTVLEEVKAYVKTLAVGDTFDLHSASATYRSIEMAQFKGQQKTPKAVRASIGRSFVSKIGTGPFTNVRKATFVDKNGNRKQRLSVNNALMYEVVDVASLQDSQ